MTTTPPDEDRPTGVAAWVAAGAALSARRDVEDSSRPPLTPPPAGRKPGSGLLVALATAAVAVAVVLGVGLYYVLAVRETDTDRVRAEAKSFRSAVRSGKTDAIADHLCAPEAAAIRATARSADTSAPVGLPKSRITAVEVRDRYAVATIQFENGRTGRMYLNRKGDDWQVCAAARTSFDKEASR